MSRITTPATIETSPASSRPFLETAKKMLGSVPNLFRMVGNSPAALEGYLGLNSALAKGKLDAKTRERIALAVAEVNGCNYCLAAHTYLGKSLAKMDDVEIAANRHGTSGDVKANVAVRFAVKIANTRGHIADADLKLVTAAGYGDDEVIEIVSHVALNTLTNYINNVAATDVDFPTVEVLKNVA